MQDTPKNTHGGSRGGGRPKIHNEPTVSISFDCPESLTRFVDNARRGKGQSRSAYLVALVKAEQGRTETQIAETDAFIVAHDLPL